jgi:oligopeptide transport system ATP-binding protein
MSERRSVGFVEGEAEVEPVLRAVEVSKFFPVRGRFGRGQGQLRAVDSVSLAVGPQQTLGLVGESGSGKTTLGWTLARLHEPTAGRIEFEGRDISHLGWGALKEVHRRLQVVFQNPWTSLDPQYSVEQTLLEPLEIHAIGSRRDREARIKALLELVGLHVADRHRYPHELSGGQRQRVVIARALALEPSFVVADEPTSSLDVSVQAQIVNLFQDLQERLGLSLLFITHNLHLVRWIGHRVAVMYLGRVVESGPTERLFERPLHPYTAALLGSRSTGVGSKRLLLKGEVPSPLSPPSGCRFRTRCPIARERCALQEPALVEVEPDHLTACFYPGEGTP